jgi:VWFA-related protein
VFQVNGCGIRKWMSERRNLGIVFFLFVAVSFLVPRADCQESQQNSPKTDTAAKAQEISLNLSVHDKRGRQVLDLKSGEIAITDDGSPVALDSLRLVTGNEEGDRLITLVFDLPGLAAGNKRGIDPSIRTARETAAKILKMVPASGFSFSVLNIVGRLHLQQGFTTDRKAVEQAINAATELAANQSDSTVSEPEQQLMKVALTGSNPSGTPVSAHERALARALLAALNTSGRIEQDQHLRPSPACLLALAQSQQQIAQRKALIYFTLSKDWKLDSHARDRIKSIIGAANGAGVSLYVVDLKSLGHAGSESEALDRQMALASRPPSAELTGQSNAMRGTLTNMRVDKPQESEQLALQQLAEETGGSYIGNEDNLKKPLVEMVKDMTVYYEATYSPKIDEYDGKFRSIAVKPVRAGLKIRSQSGYLALPTGSIIGSSPQQFEMPLLKILSQSQLPADVPLRAAILRMGNLPNGNTNELAIEVPLSSLEIREDSSTNLYSARLSIVADVKDKSGAVVEHFSEDIPRRGALREIDAAKHSVITFQRHFMAPPGEYILQAAVLDRNSGKSGAQRTSFEIPAAPGNPSLSDVVLVRKVEPVRTKEDQLEPLRDGENKVTPNLSGQIPAGAKNVSVFMIAHSDAKAAAPATLDIRLFREGGLLGGTSINSQQAGASEYTSRMVTFAISRPMSGRFEVKAILNQNGKTVESSASFAFADAEAGSEEEPAENTGSSLAQTAPRTAGALSITFPSNPNARPAPAELESMLAEATKNALDYATSLPNFMCEQVTTRSTDKSGKGEWKRKDEITELLTYFEHEEKRTMLTPEHQDSNSHSDRKDFSLGMSSSGEFGTVLKGIFQPSSKATFQWKETGVLGDDTVQVFDYRVARQNSTFTLQQKDTAQIAAVGFHGQVYIDSATRRVRRVTQVTDDVPAKFPIRASSVSVDYDYVVVNDHDYLMPISAQIITSQGRRNHSLNEIEFRNFRRFGSNARLVNSAPEAKP